jgi:branched-chain amino acid transport system substrate-binding protein
MSPAALAGFSAAWALFTDVIAAGDLDVGRRRRRRGAHLGHPAGSLPNGSGLRFGARGTAQAGDNLAAASVIWKWVRPGEAAVIWPKAFATDAMDPTTVGAW